jgi:hypothetical protein
VCSSTTGCELNALAGSENTSSRNFDTTSADTTLRLKFESSSNAHIEVGEDGRVGGGRRGGELALFSIKEASAAWKISCPMVFSGTGIPCTLAPTTKYSESIGSTLRHLSSFL